MARHLYVSWNMCNSQPSGLHELGRAALDADLYGIYVAQLRALGPATAWVVRAIDISSDCVLLSVVAHGMLCCCRRGSHREMGWVAPCATQALALPGALLDSQLVQTWSRSSPLDCLKSVHALWKLWLPLALRVWLTPIALRSYALSGHCATALRYLNASEEYGAWRSRWRSVWKMMLTSTGSRILATRWAQLRPRLRAGFSGEMRVAETSHSRRNVWIV
jgi:hypothetical protein